MTRIERSALAPFSSEQMFALVNDVESYPKFLPGCQAVTLLNKNEDPVTGNGTMKAQLELGKFGVNQSFTTENIFECPRTIKLHLVDGPFKRFSGEWIFESLREDACKVTFWLEFEFASRMLALAAGKLFEQVASEQVKAMCDRAAVIYSK